MYSKLPVVTVVLSSFNGERYIEDQISSVLKQKGVTVRLLVRDDGSTDETVKVVKRIAERDGRVRLIEGANVGFAKSFLDALRKAPQGDYYAFCDQDDIWLPDKLSKLVELCASGGQGTLSYCNAIETDANLNKIGVLYRNQKSPIPPSMVFTDSMIHGFLMIFDSYLYNEAIKVGYIGLSHDTLLTALAVLTGRVLFKDEVLALHRRLDSSVSGVPRSKVIPHQIRTALKGSARSAYCAGRILDSCKDCIYPDYYGLLNDMVEYQYSLDSKLRLIMRDDLCRDGRFGRVIMILKVLLHRY